MPRTRRRPLEAELVRRWPELAETAEELILAGAILVDGLARTNPTSVVDETSSIRVVAERRPLRGYEKLQAALSSFGVDAAGRIALDAGAAAGGFVRALLEAGATRVYAVEVGHGQLIGSLRQNERVVNLERTNIGALTRVLVPDPIELISLDLGFLALAVGVPQLNVLDIAVGADLVALVKPMAELRLGRLPGGDEAVMEAIARASAGIEEAGWRVTGAIDSPIRGSRGAVEALVHARRP